MALTKQNIIVGAARVFIGPSGDARPTATAGTRYATALSGADGSTATGDGTVVTNWREVGYTQDGLEIATDPSYGEVEVDQLLDSALIFKDGMSLSISTTMAEATLENLLVAWGQAASSLNESAGTAANRERELTIESGNLGQAPLERGLIAIGNAPRADANSNSYGERVYHAFRVLSVEGTSLTNSRAEAATIPVTFRALPQDDGRYGVIRDRINVT